MRIAIVAAASLTLAGCVTAGNTISVTCASLDGAHQGFLAYNEEHPLKQSILDVELAVFSEGKGLCRDRGVLTPAQALARIAAAGAQIAVMLWEAERSKGVVAPL